MKKLLLSLFVAAGMFAARADEGMWIPHLIGKNYEDMKRMGLKLSKEDLYSINQASLKDAVVQFGGGCTGEIISPNGLLITNHHCGYGAIAGLSSVEKNYLDNGFWAYNYAQELPAQGITALFLDHIEDVTDEVNAATKKLKGDKLNKKMDEVRKKIEERAAQNKKYTTQVKEYFNGNQYLLLVYKKYTDVRLVGTPPKSLGKFGGDTDNWMWPRHTADFSMFRVYADKNNEPAEYSKDNVPFRPKKYLPVSIKGMNEGDFAMIFGYPGRTNRYEISGGIETALSETNPSIVNIRDKRLAIMRKHMDADKSVYLKLTSGYQNVSNYWKYFIGQTEQLNRLKVVDQKKANETAFTQWAVKNKKSEYKNLATQYNNLVATYHPYAKYLTYYSEAFRASALTRLAASLTPLHDELAKAKPNADTVKMHTKNLKSNYKLVMRSFDQATDREVFAEMNQMYYNDVAKAQHPSIFQTVVFRKFGNADQDKVFNDYAAHVFDNTFLLDSNQINAFVANPTLEKLDSDPAFLHAYSFVSHYEENYKKKYEDYNAKKRDLAKTYIKGLMEMNEGKLFYPDANSTMRITYGTVASYEPKDAVHFDYYTTLDGAMEKYKPGDDEFDLPQELVDLYKKKDYGRYANSKGELVTCFITTNDITGGNSGSPLINGNGEWAGIAFDGNWEAMSGDIAFDKTYKRTINTDARFILFIIDKMGKAHNLLEEMDIRK